MKTNLLTTVLFTFATLWGVNTCFSHTLNASNKYPITNIWENNYNWSSSAAIEEAKELSVGCYLETVTASITAQTNVSCNGGSNGSATVEAGGGTAPYTYLWNDPAPAQTTATCTNLTAGVWTVTVLDANLLSATASVTITQPLSLTANIPSHTNVSCNGGNNGSATASPSGGTPAYTYLWSNGQTTSTANTLIAGIYTITVRDVNNCTSTSSVTITQPTTLVASISSSTNVSCNGGNNGSATASQSGGTAPYTYLWDNAQTTATGTTLTSGTWSVTVTSIGGCTSTSSVTINQPTALTASISAYTNVSCNGGSNGSVTATGSGGTPGYTYNWSNGQTTSTANNLIAGTYTVTVRDMNNCSTTSSQVITQPSLLSASITAQTNIDCSGSCIGSATVTANGGSLSYSYFWSPGDLTSTTINTLCAGNYFVTVTDANGCTKTTNATITNPGALSITTQPLSYNKCLNSNVTFTLNASSPSTITYVWKKNGTPITGATSNIYTINGLGLSDEGIYTCEPTNYCRTLVSDNAELKVIDLNVNAGTDITFCNDTATHLIAVATTNHPELGLLNYSWSPTTNLGSPNSASTTAQPINNTTYTISVTDQTGCTKTDAIIVTSKTPVSITTQPLSYNKCLNSNVTFTLNASGTAPISYVWKKNGTPITGATSNTYTINGLSLTDEGIYTCEPTNYCRTLVSDNAELKVIDLNVSAGTDITFCNDTATHLIAVATTNHSELGLLNYSWSPTTNLGSPNSPITTAQPIINTTYTISVTDQVGCSKTDAIIVTSKTPVSITTQPLSYNKCLSSNVTFTLNASGTAPISYVWKKNGTPITGATSNAYSINGLGLSDEGIFTCEPTNYCRTLISDNAELKVIDITANAGTDARICNSHNTQLQAIGGTNHITESGILNYNWSPNIGLSNTSVANPSANPTLTTNYTVTVTDQLGCSETDQVNIIVQNIFQNEQICLVTVDTITWKNKVMWEKTAGVGSDYYLIYKETGLNSYTQISNVIATQPSEYIDLFSVPESHGDKYKISVLDTCGDESNKSYFHKTMNLTIAAFGSTMGLNWDDYVDESGNYAPFRYYIYRGTSPNSMALHDSVSGSFNSYNDVNVFNVYYYIIGVKKLGGCNTTKSADFISFSNKKDNSTLLGINTPIFGTITVSPNPFSESTTLTIPNSLITNYELRIMDVTGKTIRTISNLQSVIAREGLTEAISPPHQQIATYPSVTRNDAQFVIDRGDLKPGVYFVELRGDRVYRGKLIIE